MKVTRDYLRKVIQETLELEASKKPSAATKRTVQGYKNKVRNALYTAMAEAGDVIRVLSQSSYKDDNISADVDELKQIKAKIKAVYEEIYGEIQQPKSSGGSASKDSSWDGGRGSDFWAGSGGPNDR